ncbi:MAG: GntR family transcriptional regulator [Trueperaceae bacterium]|nr:GntR family transcriptional regulator [Trueperaceae bacterium]
MAKAVIQSKSKTEQVYDYLYEQIINCERAPGSRLVIDQIASDLGVSQIPIREAIFRLEKSGFVTFETHVGAKVAELHAEHISEIFQVLEAMEVISGRAACARICPKELKHLEKLTQKMAHAVHDPNQWSQYNMEFHQYICDIAETGLVKKMLHEALSHWDRLRHSFLKEVSAKRVELAQQEHSLLLEALNNKDADAFEAVVRQHNQASLKAYIAHLEAIGELDAA